MNFSQPQFIAFLKANSSTLRKHFSLDTQDQAALYAFITCCQEILQYHDVDRPKGKQKLPEVYKLSRKISSSVTAGFPFSSFRLDDQVYLLASDPLKPREMPPDPTHAGQEDQKAPPLPQHYVGKGSFGVVKLVIPLKINNESAYELYVAKITRLKGAAYFPAEVYFLKEMNQLIHAGAREDKSGVQTSANEDTNHKCYIIMPYFSGGDLSSKLSRHQTNEEVITAKELVRFLLQAALYIRRLHSKNIIHGDIKPANMMLNQVGEVVFVDFGFAEYANRSLNRMNGTEEYLPQVINANGIVNKGLTSEFFRSAPHFNAKNRDLYAFFMVFHKIYRLLREDEQKHLNLYLSTVISRCFLNNPMVKDNVNILYDRMASINQLILDELIARLILFDVGISISELKRNRAFPPALVSLIIKYYSTPGDNSWHIVTKLILQEQLSFQECIDVAASNCPNDLLSFLMTAHCLSDDVWLTLLKSNLPLFIQHYIGHPRLDYSQLPRSQEWLRGNQVFPLWISVDLIKKDKYSALPYLFLHSPELLTSLPPLCESCINNDEYLINLVDRVDRIIPSIPDAMMTPSLLFYILTDKKLGHTYHDKMYERLLRFTSEKQCSIVVHMLSHLKKARNYDWENAQNFLWKSLRDLPQAAFDFSSFRDLVAPTNSLRPALESLVTMMLPGTGNKDFLQALLDSANTKSTQEEAAPPVHHPSPLHDTRQLVCGLSSAPDLRPNSL